MAGPGDDEDADWLRELLAPQSNSSKSRDGAWADDAEITDFPEDFLSAKGSF